MAWQEEILVSRYHTNWLLIRLQDAEITSRFIRQAVTSFIYRCPEDYQMSWTRHRTRQEHWHTQKSFQVAWSLYLDNQSFTASYKKRSKMTSDLQYWRKTSGSGDSSIALMICSPPPTCHVLHVMWHTTHVTCHVSHVTCHLIYIHI